MRNVGVFFVLFLIHLSMNAQVSDSLVKVPHKFGTELSDSLMIKKETTDSSGHSVFILKQLTGEVYSIQQVKYNLKNGVSKWFNKNGTLLHEGNYKFDKPVGEHHYYDLFGEHQRTEIYNRSGKVIAEYYWGDNEQKIYSISKKLACFSNYKNEQKSFIMMGKFIDKELIKPDVSEDYAEAVVAVSFLIAPNGSLENIEITQGIDPLMDQAVIDMVNKMPKWSPAVHRGKKVYSAFYLSVNF